MTSIATTIESIKSESTALNARIHTLMAALDKKEKDDIKKRKQKKADLEKYVNQQRQELEKEKEVVKAERAAWEAEKESLANFYKFKNKIVKINAGGTLMTTRLSTLTCAGGMLEALFSGRFEPDKDEEGNVFIDLDGSDFSQWLKLLRQVANGQEPFIPEHLEGMEKFLQPNTKQKRDRDRYNQYGKHLVGI